MTSPEIGAINKHLPVILPIAATEQHGPHLPVATDHMIAEHFVNTLSQQIPDQVIILPTFSIGYSEHHMAFTGTLTFSHTTFVNMIGEVLSSVVAHGFKNLIIFNAHGGNQAIGQVAVEMFGSRHAECQVILATWWRIASQKLIDITQTGLGGIGHACEFETSLMLHIAPELVHDEFITTGGNQPTFHWAEGDMLRGSQASLYRPMNEMTSNGVYGDPTAASAEKGRLIEIAVVQELKTIVTSLL